MTWFKKKKIKPSFAKKERKIMVTEGLWEKCQNCKEIIYKKEIEGNFRVCPKCNYHFRISAEERIQLVADEESFQELDSEMVTTDPLHFKDSRKYRDRLKEGEQLTRKKDALVYGDVQIHGLHAILAVFDFGFMGGSMGSVVGEKVTRSIERTIKNNSALVIVNCSGGARMQEGILSLMQMAKTSSALEQLSEHKLPYISDINRISRDLIKY